MAEAANSQSSGERLRLLVEGEAQRSGAGCRKPGEHRKARLIASALLLASLLAPSAMAQAPGSDAPEATAAVLGIDLAAMDRSVDPGQDFYAYANGAWLRRTEIPADRAGVGGFTVAEQATERQLEALLAEIVASNPAPGSAAARIKTFYQAYLDTAAIEAPGMALIRPELDRIMAIADKRQLAAAIGSTLRADVDPLNATDFDTENLFGVFVTQALAGGEVMPYLLQGGLGMPERQYYLADDPKMAANREAYRAYVAALLAAAGIGEAEARAQRIYDLEMKIARAHASREESEDWTRAAQIWNRADFPRKAPGLDWTAFFGAAQLGSQARFNAYHSEAIARLSALVASEPLTAWKDWLLFHRLNQNTDVLPERLDRLRFAFYGTRLSGIEAQRPRAKRALAALNAHLGDDLGRLYTARYFPASAKREIEGMVRTIKAAFARRIKALDWMAPATRKEALAKVASMEVGVGYPDRWRDYADLRLSPNAYANKRAAQLHRYAQQLAKAGRPLDRREWWMNAQLVNAVNLPVQNALNFPAAILQRPFFDPAADSAFNYGAIGAVIGHEISHGFDNNGAAFDATGAMRNWWTPADLARFKQAGKALAEQYGRYEPFPSVRVNGELTLGENIADLAGLAAAYDAYRASLGGKEAPVIAGFTGDQRFFIAYAQAWATKMREAQARQRLLTDGHAPGQYRALAVRNLDAWYKAFDVRPDDALYLAPEQRVKVW